MCTDLAKVKHKVSDHVIAFDNTPFSLGEKRILNCQYGHHYYNPIPAKRCTCKDQDKRVAKHILTS